MDYPFLQLSYFCCPLFFLPEPVSMTSTFWSFTRFFDAFLTSMFYTFFLVVLHHLVAFSPLFDWGTLRGLIPLISHHKGTLESSDLTSFLPFRPPLLVSPVLRHGFLLFSFLSAFSCVFLDFLFPSFLREISPPSVLRTKRPSLPRFDHRLLPDWGLYVTSLPFGPNKRVLRRIPPMRDLISTRKFAFSPDRFSISRCWIREFPLIAPAGVCNSPYLSRRGYVRACRFPSPMAAAPLSRPALNTPVFYASSPRIFHD